MKKGAKRMAAGDSSVTFRYDEGRSITDAKLLKTSKTSFHASGTINCAGERITGMSLRTLKKPMQLCMAIFSHPLKYATIDKPKGYDIVINDPIIEENPMIAQIYLTPMSNPVYMRKEALANQMLLVFEVTGLDGVPDLLFQVLLTQPVSGQWPPYSYILFATPESIP